MSSPILVRPADFLTELHASRVYARTSHPQRNSSTSGGDGGGGGINGHRRRHSFSSEAALFESLSLTSSSSFTLLDSRASSIHPSSYPSSQSTLYVGPVTTPSAADYSVDAALNSFRPPSIYSLSSHGSNLQRYNYSRDLAALPGRLGRPLPAANPPTSSRGARGNFSAQRARPRSNLQPLTLASIHDRFSLLQACKTGDVSRVSTLLSAGVDPNTRDFSSSSLTAPTSWHQHPQPHHSSTTNAPTVTTPTDAAAIHIATLSGHYEIVRLLLHHGARVDEPFRGFRRPLHESVQLWDSAMTVLLLDNGADVTARDERGYQPLHVAVIAGSVACARLLVWAGAPVNAIGHDALTCLHHVAMSCGPVAAVTAGIVGDGVVRGGGTVAVGGGGGSASMELVELLLGAGADVGVRTRWLLGNKLASEIAREKGWWEMEARLVEAERNAAAVAAS